MDLVETQGTGNWFQFSQWVKGTEGLQWGSVNFIFPKMSGKRLLFDFIPL